MTVAVIEQMELLEPMEIAYAASSAEMRWLQKGGPVHVCSGHSCDRRDGRGT
jgi:hypothetical protein